MLVTVVRYADLDCQRAQVAPRARRSRTVRRCTSEWLTAACYVRIVGPDRFSGTDTKTLPNPRTRDVFDGGNLNTSSYLWRPSTASCRVDATNLARDQMAQWYLDHYGRPA